MAKTKVEAAAPSNGSYSMGWLIKIIIPATIGVGTGVPAGGYVVNGMKVELVKVVASVEAAVKLVEEVENTTNFRFDRNEHEFRGYGTRVASVEENISAILQSLARIETRLDIDPIKHERGER